MTNEAADIEIIELRNQLLEEEIHNFSPIPVIKEEKL